MARPRTISDDQILSTARQCFLQHGPAVSTDIIAEQLGVSPQALFKRFHHKQDLLLAAVLPTEPAPWIPLVESGPDDRDIRVQLAEILTELADFFVDIARRMSVLKWSGLEARDLLNHFDEPPPLVDIRVLSGWLQRAAEQGLVRCMDFKAAAMLILTSMHGPAMLTDMLGEHPTGHSREDYVNFMVDTLLQGMLPAADTATSS